MDNFKINDYLSYNLGKKDFDLNLYMKNSPIREKYDFNYKEKSASVHSSNIFSDFLKRLDPHSFKPYVDLKERIIEPVEDTVSEFEEKLKLPWTGDIPKAEMRSLLGLADIPHYSDVRKSESDLVSVCCALYNCEPDDLSVVKRDESFYYLDRCWRFNASFKSGDEKTFYVKELWQHDAILEVFANALANLLWKPYYTFVGSDSTGTLASDAIPGRLLNCLSECDFSEKAMFSYGVAVELADALALWDRHGKNVILSDEEDVVQIDFGTVFTRDISKMSYENICCHVNLLKTKAVKRGRIEGKEMICENFKAHKASIKEMIAYVRHVGVSFEHAPVKHLSSYTNSSLAVN